jgi:hypothetical protein
VLVLTGIWNVSAVHASNSTHAWKAVLSAKIVIVVLAGLGAWLHGRAKEKKSRAIWASVGGVASITAVVLGVLLAG